MPREETLSSTISMDDRGHMFTLGANGPTNVDDHAMEIQSRQVTSADGTAIAVKTAGPIDAPLLVLANGLAGNATTWTRLIEAYAGTFRVINWDYRALYDSGRPAEAEAIGVEAYADDLQAALAEERPGPACIIGWSAGAQVALEYASRQPDSIRALVLLNPLWGPQAPPRLRHRAPLHALIRFAERLTTNHRAFQEIPDALIASERLIPLLQGIGLVGKTVDEASFKEVLQALANLDPMVFLASYRKAEAYDAWARLGTVDAPTLLMTGSRDPWSPVDAMLRAAAQLKDAEHMVVRRATHYAILEHPEIVTLRIEKFFRERGLL